MTRSEVPTKASYFASLEREFGAFDLDPCATKANAKALQYYEKRDDGLEQPWHGRVFCNPPYERGVIGRWVGKAVCEVSLRRAEYVVMLIPASCSARWWHDYVEPFATGIRFLRGRARYFDHPRGSLFRPRFEPALVVFGRARLPGFGWWKQRI